MIFISGIFEKWRDFKLGEARFQLNNFYYYHWNLEQTAIKEQPLEKLVTSILSDLAHANRSPHTRQVYATDLALLCEIYHGLVNTMEAEILLDSFRMNHTLQKPYAFDSYDFKLQYRLEGHKSIVLCISWSHDGPTLASMRQSGTMKRQRVS